MKDDDLEGGPSAGRRRRVAASPGSSEPTSEERPGLIFWEQVRTRPPTQEEVAFIEEPICEQLRVAPPPTLRDADFGPKHEVLRMRNYSVYGAR